MENSHFSLVFARNILPQNDDIISWQTNMRNLSGLFYKLYNFHMKLLYSMPLFGQGKLNLSQGKVSEKSGNFEILIEWQP